MRALLLLALALPSWGASYYLSPTGSDGNNGTSTGTPWLTPNHALNCGDTITAAASSTYNYLNFSETFGTVTCASGNNVAWLICAQFDTCKITVSDPHDYSNGMLITSNYWGVQGWEVTASSSSGGCFSAYPAGGATIHHIIFANNICNSAGSGGFLASENGSAGVDYIAYIGNIAYNTTQGNTFCYSALDIVNPATSDSKPGTHQYIAGNFAWDNVDPNPCAGVTPTDGEGVILDTFNANGYDQQAVVDNNILIFNGGAGIRAYQNTSARIYIRRNTTYGNQKTGISDFICGENEQSISPNTETFANLSVTALATGCSTASALYAYTSYQPNSTNHVYANYGYSASGNNTSGSGTGFSFGPNNTFANPNLAGPVDPGSPSCGAYASVPACAAAVIANLSPTAAAAKPYGYQIPSSVNVYDPLFPQWLCNVNLPSGLVSMGCLVGSGVSGVTLSNGATLTQ